MKSPLPKDESQRLATLRRYDVLDTPPEQAFDDLTLLAAQICQVPSAVVSLLDENRQWFKSRVGMPLTETPRDISFCTHTILHKDGVMVVHDAQQDPRFAQSPLVTGELGTRFYAGTPLTAPDGHAVGALCVMDHTPRTLTPDQLAALSALGRHVVAQLESRRQARELAVEVVERRRAEDRLQKQNDQLSENEKESRRLLTIAEKSRRGLLSVLEDEKHAGQNLRESEERFRQLAENIKEVFWITDTAKQAMLYVSPAFDAIWGQSRESLYTDPPIWLASIHPDDRARVAAAVTGKQLAGTYDEEYRIVRPDGALRWIRDRAFPVRHESGEVYRLVGVAEDITERKNLETQFLRAQRVEAIGMLASGMAHDLNNILAPILMSAPLLRLGLSAEKTERTLATIEESAQRGADLVRQLLTFGRGVEGDRRVIQPRPLVLEMLKIARQTFPKNILVVENVSKSVWPIMGDTTQLHQVLLNLSVNARDAMPQGGSLTIAIENVRFDQGTAAMTPGASPGPYVLLRVTDTGTGIPPAVLDRIFDPFFTTKEVGKGTGLGLSTVIGIAKNHGGFVTVNSEMGNGSSFQVYLPALPEGEAVTEEDDTVTAPTGHGELILVVDDEEKIREVIRDILVKYGYKVITAKDGAEATMVYALHNKEIQAVITDLEMPLMDGVTLIQVIKKMNPAVAVLVSSGIASKQGMESRRAELEALGAKTILKKPYTVEKILQAVHELLRDQLVKR
jgi:two-component system cell cycle sensor histidine kinase/response regulator CckA